MHSSFITWTTILSVLPFLGSIVANELSVQARDSSSALQTLLGGPGNNVYTWDADSTTYNLTFQIDPNCLYAVNESQTVGPYRDSKGYQFPDATLGDIANDVNNDKTSGALYRSTRRNVVEADRAIQNLISNSLICDGTTGEFHDDLRKLLDINHLTWTFLGATFGWVVGAAITLGFQNVIDGVGSVGDSVAAGFVLFFAVIISSIVQRLYTMERTANAPYLFFNAIAANAMRAVNFIRHGRSVYAIGGDVEMGNPGGLAAQGEGLGNNGAGGKIKRDSNQCVQQSDAKDAFKKISGYKSDDLGLTSWTEVSQTAGTCPLSG